MNVFNMWQYFDLIGMGAGAMCNTYNDFKCKLKACFPIGYECELLSETQNDIGCNWRRIRICHKGRYLDINVTCDHFTLNFKECSERFVEPVIKFLNRKDVKMTREEAVKKAMHPYGSIEQAKLFVERLEALGLLKFDEAPGPDCRELIFSNQKPLAYQVIAQLEDLGYKVDKRS